MFDFLAHIPLIGSTLAYLLPFLLVLGVVVFIHEYGHYITGRLCGIKVETFSIGFGPVLASWQDKHKTRWQIAAVPLGGYVKFLGDQNAASTQGGTVQPHYPARAHFYLAPLWARALTVFAGPLANFILSLVVFGVLIAYHGLPNERLIIDKIHPQIAMHYDLQDGDEILTIDETADFGSLLTRNDAPRDLIYQIKRDGRALQVTGPFPFIPIVGSIIPVSPARKAGLKAGDIVTHIDGQPVSSFAALRDMITQGMEQTRVIEVLRDAKPLRLIITPQRRALPSADGRIEERIAIGITAGSPFAFAPRSASISEVVTGSIRALGRVITDSINGVESVIRGDIGVENLQGPVGIAHVAGDVAKSGWIDLIAMIGYLSVAIGFLNLLPIPVLDGGHLVMFAYEAVLKRPPNAQVVHYLTLGAMSLLLSLMVVVTFNDILRVMFFVS